MKKRSVTTGRSFPPHPGEILLSRCLIPLGISLKEFSYHIRTGDSTVRRICHCMRGLSPSIAWRLSYAFGTNPLEWMKIHINYMCAKYWNENSSQILAPESKRGANLERIIEFANFIDSTLEASIPENDGKCLVHRSKERIPFGLPKNPVHPGEILKQDFLMPLGIRNSTIFNFPGLSSIQIANFLDDHCSLSCTHAFSFYSVFGIPPTVWLAIQYVYDLVNVYLEIPEISMLDKVFLHNVEGIRDSILKGMESK